MAEQAYAYVTLIPVAKGFQKEIANQLDGVGGVGGSAGKQAGAGFSKGFGGALKGVLGPIAATLSTVAIGSFVKDAVGAASSLSAEYEGVNQIFGAAAKSVQDFASNAAFSVGVTETAALQAAKGFGVFAGAAGLAGQDAAGFSTALVQAAGDLASFNDVPVEETLAAIKSGLQGQGEPLSKYGILMNEATLKEEAFRQGIIDTTDQALTPQQRVLAANALILGNMGAAQGDFVNYQTTFGNALKTTTALFDEMKAELGEALIPALEELLPALQPMIETVTPILIKLFQALVPIIGTLADNLTPLLNAFLPLVDVIVLIVDAAGEILAQVLPLLIDVFAALTPVILQVVEAFLPLIMNLLPPLIKLFEAIMPIVMIIVEYLTNYLIPILEDLGKFIGFTLIGVIEALTEGFSFLESVLGPLWAKVKPILDGIMWFMGIEPGQLEKEIKITVDDTELRKFDNVQFTGSGGTLEFLQGMGMGGVSQGPLITGGGVGGGGENLQDAARQAIKDARAGIRTARSEYRAAVREARANYRVVTAEIEESYQSAIADATTTRDANLAEALKSHTLRLADINKDFAKRQEDIITQSMNRLRDAYKGAVEINVASIFNSDVVAGSIDGTIEMMRKRLLDARQLVANAAALQAAGFSQTFIEQVVAAGPELGNELATSILNSSPEQKAEMRSLFDSIETEASHGMDSLAETLYEKNGLATEELRNLYAQNQVDLANALAEQEALYAEEMTNILAIFDESVLAAKETRDDALADAKKDLTNALADANKQFVDDITQIEKTFEDKISGMRGQVGSLASQIANLETQLSNLLTGANANTGTSAPNVALAKGGLVTKPTTALIGEAGPEVVIPLDRFESMMSMMSMNQPGGALNYYAAPNTSLDSEQELFTAMKRAKVVVGW